MMNLENISSIPKPAVPFEQATGSPKYGLTNDYMLRVVFQENELARKGLIAAVLHMNPDHILSYLCRSFDQLCKGEDYAEAKPATHIGFLNFAPFPERLEFNGCYKLLNVKNHAPYSDKLTLYVVDLTHIELATEEDKSWGIDHWARLFTATTWEEVKMIAEKDIHMQAAAEEMYVLSADEMIEERCRARDDYMKLERTRNKIMKELTETNTSLLNEKEALLNEIESLHKRIAELESQNS